MKPTAAPKSAKPIQDGLVNIVETDLVTDSDLWAMATDSGLQLKGVSRTVVGAPDAIFSGTADDVGEELAHSGIPRMCAVRVLGAVIKPNKRHSPVPGGVAADSLVLAQLIDSVLAMESQDIQVNSEFARMLDDFSRCEARGVPDEILRVAYIRA